MQRLHMSLFHYAGFYEIMQVLHDRLNCDILKDNVDIKELPEHIKVVINDDKINADEACVMSLGNTINQCNINCARLYLFKTKKNDGNFTMDVYADESAPDSLKVLEFMSRVFGGEFYYEKSSIPYDVYKGYVAWDKVDIYADITTIGEEERIIAIKATAFSIEDNKEFASFYKTVKLPKNYFTDVSYVMNLMENKPSLLRVITSDSCEENMVANPQDALVLFNNWINNTKKGINNMTVWTNRPEMVKSIIEDQKNIHINDYDLLLRMAAIKSGVFDVECFKKMYQMNVNDHKSVIGTISAAWNTMM